MAKTFGPYSPAVRAGDWLICSGQVGVADGKLVDGGMEPELRQAIANLRALLDANGAALGDVVKVTVFLTDMGQFGAMNDVYVDEFDGNRPARSAVGVAALPIGAVIELEAWAWIGAD